MANHVGVVASLSKLETAHHGDKVLHDANVDSFESSMSPAPALCPIPFQRSHPAGTAVTACEDGDRAVTATADEGPADRRRTRARTRAPLQWAS